MWRKHAAQRRLVTCATPTAARNSGCHPKRRSEIINVAKMAPAINNLDDVSDHSPAGQTTPYHEEELCNPVENGFDLG
jgi:hypothetical protein